MRGRKLLGLFGLLVATALAADPVRPAGGMESSALYSWPTQQAPRFLFPLAEEDFKELTSPYGWRISPLLRVLAHHDGVDIEGVYRAQVVAVADGWVDEYWPPPDGWFRGHPTYGGLVVLRHPDGSRTLYAHLSEIYVVGWQRVHAGQVLGRVGMTGKAVGIHLHFEIILDGARVNPLLYIALPAGARRVALP